jgi:hypothetical protein
LYQILKYSGRQDWNCFFLRLLVCNVNVALIVLQNLTGPEKERNLCREISSAFSRDEHEAISVKTEVLTAATAEEDPLAITFPAGIKAEPEVSCVSMPLFGLVLRTFAAVNNLHY